MPQTAIRENTLIVPRAQQRFGLIVSNGYGLGHVSRMQAFAKGLTQFGSCAFMSLSAGLVEGAYYMPSAHYLALPDNEAVSYTRGGVTNFIKAFHPTHLVYDGNVVPPGLIAALSHRPDIHLTWVRRGFWHEKTYPAFLAAQAQVDLVIEPGDLADIYDTGPTARASTLAAPPRAFLKIPPVKNMCKSLPRGAARTAIGLSREGRYALIMTGAVQHDEDAALIEKICASVRMAGLVPVAAHWPMAQMPPPDITDALMIECMGIAQYYTAFDLIISAAGYNSYHEILDTDVPCVFVPQEDAGRDNQLARARYAADQGWAALCRRTEIDSLPSILSTLSAQHRPPISWQTDWRAIAQAMKAAHGAAGEEIKLPQETSGFTRIMKAGHKKQQRRRKSWAVDFILAMDMSAADFHKKFSGDSEGIIVTNSIDPVYLRRRGLKYLWINGGTRRALMRQCLHYLSVWRPRRIVSL